MVQIDFQEILHCLGYYIFMHLSDNYQGRSLAKSMSLPYTAQMTGSGVICPRLLLPMLVILITKSCV